MTASNPLNVYAGPDSLINYHDPSCQPPLPLVEIPGKLNPFRDDGVRIYAKMLTMLPSHNVKSLPALRMLQPGNGITKDTKTVVEYSSGSTVISMAVLGRVLHNISDTRAYMSNKTSEVKIQLLRLFGLEVTLFGGPSQPEPSDPRGGIQRATAHAREDASIYNPNQYENPLNPDAHVCWTGPQILKQLPQINVFCAGMGTSGTMTGIGTYLKSSKPSIFSIGVCTAPGDRVPGPRSYALLKPVEFPWRDAIDTVEEVGSHDSFRLSLELTREGLVCGPSSGFNLQGLYNFLQKRKDEGTLKDLAGEDGDVHCVFICCDLPYQYIHEYFEKLGDEHFRPIVNDNLVGVDKYRYDEAWEIPLVAAIGKLYPTQNIHSDFMDRVIKPSQLKRDKSSTASLPGEGAPRLAPGFVILDLRTDSSFRAWHLPEASHFPVSSLDHFTPSPFAESSVLRQQWLELDDAFKSDQGESLSPERQSTSPASPAWSAGWLQWIPGLSGTQTTPLAKGDRATLDYLLANKLKVVLVDYDGDTARVASSVLRAKGVEAWSLRDGMRALEALF